MIRPSGPAAGEPDVLLISMVFATLIKLAPPLFTKKLLRLLVLAGVKTLA